MDFDARQFGTILGCVEMGVSPAAFPACSGMAKSWDEQGEPAQRLIVKTAHDLMITTGYGQGAPSFHLKMVAEGPWTSHSRDVAEHIVATITADEQLEKMAAAIPAALASGGNVLKALGYGSLGVGAGLGGLYFLLSRHANQEDADIEAKKTQVDHYERLARELNESMRRKYRYPAA